MSSNNKKQKLVKKLTRKEYRDAWIDETVKMIVPYQIQAIRKKKGWSQAVLGEKAGMKSNAITRVEDTDYGNLSVNTLLRIAHGFDCGLLVKFVPFNRMVREFQDVSSNALEVNSFSDDYVNLKIWADKAEGKEGEIKPEKYTDYQTEKSSYSNDTIRDKDYFKHKIEGKHLTPILVR